MSALALIIGRAGSRGVPGKNTADIAGRPCIQYTIDAARAAGTIDRIAISTDCPTMQQLARDQRIDVVDRPAELAGDAATVDDAARHAVAAIADLQIREIVILYANVPVRPDGLIDEAVTTLRTTGADSVQSYQPVGKHHPWWMVQRSSDGTVKPWEGDVLNHGVYRRQDLPEALIPDGAVLAVTRRALFLEIPGAAPGPHAFFGADRRAIVNPEGSVIDIDAPIDLVVARAVIASQESQCSSDREQSTRTAART